MNMQWIHKPEERKETFVETLAVFIYFPRRWLLKVATIIIPTENACE